MPAIVFLFAGRPRSSRQIFGLAWRIEYNLVPYETYHASSEALTS
jgi:hypothetical protein